jgi:hypothetical protein
MPYIDARMYQQKELGWSPLLWTSRRKVEDIDYPRMLPKPIQEVKLSAEDDNNDSS